MPHEQKKTAVLYVALLGTENKIYFNGIMLYVMQQMKTYEALILV